MKSNESHLHAVATLVEGDFLRGAAVLYNSLFKNGFKGPFIIGFRNAHDLPADLRHRMNRLGSDFPKIEWVELETDWHFTNYKAHFLLKLFQKFPDFEKITYADPDIVFSECPWPWIDTWPEHGPALCGDVNWMVPAQHPTRHEWSALIRAAGFTPRTIGDIYFNGGLLGVQRKDLAFVERWHFFIEKVAGQHSSLTPRGNIGDWRKGMRSDMFLTPDQDALNMTAMSWEGPLCTFGPDAMGFLSGQPIALHAVGSPKPWARRHWFSFLAGRPPRGVDKMFWKNATHPIRVASPVELRMTHLAVLLTAFLGRFYRRR